MMMQNQTTMAQAIKVCNQLVNPYIGYLLFTSYTSTDISTFEYFHFSAESRTPLKTNKEGSDSTIDESSIKLSTPESDLKSLSSTPKDGSGVLQRFRHLSDRSWSSTSSGELGALEEARGSMPGSYQEPPMSWMPSCLSLSRRGVS